MSLACLQQLSLIGPDLDSIVGLPHRNRCFTGQSKQVPVTIIPPLTYISLKKNRTRPGFSRCLLQIELTHSNELRGLGSGDHLLSTYSCRPASGLCEAAWVGIRRSLISHTFEDASVSDDHWTPATPRSFLMLQLDLVSVTNDRSMSLIASCSVIYDEHLELRSPRGSEAALLSTSGDMATFMHWALYSRAVHSSLWPWVINVWASRKRCAERVYFISLEILARGRTDWEVFPWWSCKFTTNLRYACGLGMGAALHGKFRPLLDCDFNLAALTPI